MYFPISKKKKLITKITSVGEIKVMEKKDVKWLGLILTKKSAIYLNVLSTFGLSFFASSLMFTFPVLLYNMTNIYPYDKLTYFYTLLLFISNFIASTICICIFTYTLSRVRMFRKSLKNH